MKKLLAIVAAAEAATGVVLLVCPSIAIKLLLAAAITGTTVVMSRIAGIALIGLAVACWPSEKSSRAVCGMLIYSTLVMLYLGYLGLAGGFAGILLWPAVAVHGAVSLFLARSCLQA